MIEKLWNKAVEESKRIQNKINGTDKELPGKLGFEPHDTGPLSESWEGKNSSRGGEVTDLTALRSQLEIVF